MSSKHNLFGMLKTIFLIGCILAISQAREYKRYYEIDCKGNDISHASSRDVRQSEACINQ